MPVSLPSWMRSPTVEAPNWMDQAWEQNLRVTLPSFGQSPEQMNASPTQGPTITPPQSVTSGQQQPAFDLQGLIRSLGSPVSSGYGAGLGPIAPAQAVGGWVPDDLWNDPSKLKPKPFAYDPWGRPQSRT